MRGFVAEALGHRGLQVEHQPVLAPAGDHVQPRADQLQHALVALQLLDLERRDQPVGARARSSSCRGRPRAPPRSRPAGRAGRRGFPCSWARASTACPRTSCGAGASRASWRAGRPAGPSPRRSPARNARYSAREPQRKRDSSSAVCTVTSLCASATHSSTVRTDEPISSPMSQQAVMKPSIGRLQRVVGAWSLVGRQQHQHVDVGVREQLAAPIAAHREQRRAGRHAARAATGRPACGRHAASARAAARGAPARVGARFARSARAARPCRRESCARSVARRLRGVAQLAATSAHMAAVSAR